MLLVFDVGNTKTAVGLHDGDRWVRDWRVATAPERLPDELGALLDALLAGVPVTRDRVTGVAAASVAPTVTETLRVVAERHFGHRLFELTHRTARGIRLAVDTPEETGADRIANTVAVHRLFGTAAIVVDAGTAITFDVISAAGEYRGGAIAPGLGVSAEALVRRTARLPRVELSPPKRVIGTHTVAALRSGLIHGWTGMVREMVRLLKEEIGEDYAVIATGGLARQVADWTGVVDRVEERLTLDGVRLVYSDQVYSDQAYSDQAYSDQV